MMNLRCVLAGLVMLVLVPQGLWAQKGTTNLMVSLGPSVPVLDGGIGVHLGVNPTLALNNHLAVEGQVSYLYTRITGSFISGKQGTDQTASALAGLRLYVLGPQKIVRPYVSALIGGAFLLEAYDGQEATRSWVPGLSLGAYVRFQPWTVGLAVESAANVVLKVGYHFPG